MRSTAQKSIFILFIIFMISIPFVFSRFFSGLETFSKDWKQYISYQFGENKYSPFAGNIVILTIDDLTSYDLSNSPGINIKNWPPNRKTWAGIIDFIELGRPKVFCIGVPFKNYEDITMGVNSTDSVLSNTLSKYNNIVLGHLLYSSNDFLQNSPMTSLIETMDNPYKPVKKSLEFTQKDFFATDLSTYYSYIPMPEIFVNSASVGYINLQTDADAIVRYSQPISKVVNGGNTYYMPSLPFAAFLKYIDYNEPIKIMDNRLYLNNYSIPLNKRGQNSINWKKSSEDYTFIPLSRVIIGMQSGKKTFEYNKMTYPLEYFKDKIVIIALAQSNINTHNTSVEKGLNSAEIYAGILENYLSDAKLDNPDRIKFVREMSLNVNLLATMVMCLLIVVNAFIFKSSLMSFFNSVLLILLYMFFNIFVFAHPKIRFDIMLIYPVYMMFVALISSYFYILTDENIKKKDIVNVFGKFVSGSVLSRLLKNPGKFEMKTERKKITVMFCDVVNFTSIIEQYPEEMVLEKLNNVFKIVTSKIFKYHGTVDKFIGDAVMAYWGDPITHSNDAVYAVKSAMEIVKAIDEFNASVKDNEIKLDIKVSVNTGEALVGCIGTDNIVDYTVLGDTVNIAARMEVICSEFNKKLLISESTYREVDSFIQAEYAGNIKLKGKDIKVNLYSLGPEVYNGKY